MEPSGATGSPAKCNHIRATRMERLPLSALIDVPAVHASSCYGETSLQWRKLRVQVLTEDLSLADTGGVDVDCSVYKFSV